MNKFNQNPDYRRPIEIDKELLKSQAVLENSKNMSILDLVERIEQLEDDLFNAQTACDRLRYTTESQEKTNKKNQLIIDTFTKEYGDYEYKTASYYQTEDEVKLKANIAFEVGKRVVDDMVENSSKIFHIKKKAYGQLEVTKDTLKINKK